MHASFPVLCSAFHWPNPKIAARILGAESTLQKLPPVIPSKQTDYTSEANIDILSISLEVVLFAILLQKT